MIDWFSSSVTLGMEFVRSPQPTQNTVRFMIVAACARELCVCVHARSGPNLTRTLNVVGQCRSAAD